MPLTFLIRFIMDNFIEILILLWWGRVYIHAVIDMVNV